uniref:Uncharacterized protein n=1 Tax=viral metagenome TaxID=1070528 RepID=A0A6M3IYR6_9ZZZZ
MGQEERIDREQSELVADKFQTLTATGTLDVWDLVTNVDSSGAAVTVTLPAVEKARGKIYTITAETVGNNITITDAGDDTIFTDSVLDTADDYSVLFSNGTRWFELAAEKA